jgi:hypothetical protein
MLPGASTCTCPTCPHAFSRHRESTPRPLFTLLQPANAPCMPAGGASTSTCPPRCCSRRTTRCSSMGRAAGLGSGAACARSASSHPRWALHRSTRAHTHTRACMHVHAHARTLPACTRMHAHARIIAHAHARAHTRAHAHTRTRVHAHRRAACARPAASAREGRSRCLPRRTHARTNTRMSTHAHTCAHAHARTHVCVHAHTRARAQDHRLCEVRWALPLRGVFATSVQRRAIRNRTVPCTVPCSACTAPPAPPAPPRVAPAWIWNVARTPTPPSILLPIHPPTLPPALRLNPASTCPLA